MNNIIGLDKDNIDETTARQLKNKILKEQDCQVILYETKHGYHFELIYNKKISEKENFTIRKKYGDCKERLRISQLKSRKKTGNIDILFTMKNNYLRKRIW